MTYDNICEGCGHTFESVQSMHDDPLTMCPLCGDDKVRRVIGTHPVKFIGSGWDNEHHAKGGHHD